MWWLPKCFLPRELTGQQRASHHQNRTGGSGDRRCQSFTKKIQQFLVYSNYFVDQDYVWSQLSAARLFPLRKRRGHVFRVFSLAIRSVHRTRTAREVVHHPDFQQKKVDHHQKKIIGDYPRFIRDQFFRVFIGPQALVSFLEVPGTQRSRPKVTASEFRKSVIFRDFSDSTVWKCGLSWI